MKSISSCAEVAPLVSGYIDGLTLTADSEAQPEYFSCEWTMEQPSSLEEIRSVVISGDRGERTVPDVAAMEAAGISVAHDPRLDALGAVAFGNDVLNPVAGVQVTIVQTAQAELQISGSKFAELPGLSGPVAVDVALQLLE